MRRVISAVGAFMLALVFVMPSGNAQTPRKSIMVVDFADRAGGWQNTREAVTTRIISKLRDDQSLRVLPRDRVQEALQQAKVETAGMIDPEDAQKVAKTLAADFVIMGEVTSFDQQRAGGCLPIVGCTYTDTATVSIHGKVLDASTAQTVAEPKADVKKQTGSTSVWIGWGNVSLDNFDGQLIGKATLEAVDKFVGAVKPKLN